jgi:hypothetical protein
MLLLLGNWRWLAKTESPTVAAAGWEFVHCWNFCRGERTGRHPHGCRPVGSARPRFSALVFCYLEHCLTSGKGRCVKLVVGLRSPSLDPEELAFTSAMHLFRPFGFEIG